MIIFGMSMPNGVVAGGSIVPDSVETVQCARAASGRVQDRA